MLLPHILVILGSAVPNPLTNGTLVKEAHIPTSGGYNFHGYTHRESQPQALCLSLADCATTNS